MHQINLLNKAGMKFPTNQGIYSLLTVVMSANQKKEMFKNNNLNSIPLQAMKSSLNKAERTIT
jgi:hypothetical protein